MNTEEGKDTIMFEAGMLELQVNRADIPAIPLNPHQSKLLMEFSDYLSNAEQSDLVGRIFRKILV